MLKFNTGIFMQRSDIGKITCYQYPHWGSLYDILYSDYDIDIKYYISTFNQICGNVLELGCGTGRISLKLARMGGDITCVDISDPLLYHLCKSAKTEQLNIRVIKQDIINLSLGELYSLVIMPFSVLLDLNDQEHQLKALINIRNHLKPNGKICFDIFAPNYEYMVKTNGIPFFKKQIETEKGRILWQTLSKYDLLTQKVEKENIIEIYDYNGTLEQKCCLHHSFRFITASELLLMLHLAGYSSFQLFGGFDKQPLGAGSSEIICEAIK